MKAEEPRSPNGIRVENANGSKSVLPRKAACPTLILCGSEADKQA